MNGWLFLLSFSHSWLLRDTTRLPACTPRLRVFVFTDRLVSDVVLHVLHQLQKQIERLCKGLYECERLICEDMALDIGYFKLEDGCESR